MIQGNKLKFDFGREKLRFKLKDGFIGGAYFRGGNKSVGRFKKYDLN
jgi:hypothetical protein